MPPPSHPGALPAKRVLLTGLGKKGEFDLEKWRGAASKGREVHPRFRDQTICFSDEEIGELFRGGAG